MAIGEPPKEIESQFRIEAKEGYREPRTRVLKHDDTFAVLDQFGDIVTGDGRPDGLYHQDTRFLSQLELLLNGQRPLLLSSNPAEDNSVLPVDLANGDTVGDDGSDLPRQVIYVNRRQFLWHSAYYELLLVRNYDVSRHRLTLDIRFGADFRDIFEIRGLERSRRGTRSAERLSADSAALRYRSIDGVECVTRLRFSPAPTRLNEKAASFAIELEPRAWCRLALRVSCDEKKSSDWNVRQYYRAMRTARHAMRASQSQAVALDGTSPVFNEMTRRALSDIHMLVAETRHGPYPWAGIPWYCAPFGRDGIITALQTLWLDPSLAKGVLGFLAETQATEIDRDRDAEPGKILHELRLGEMARLKEVPFARYYGSIDATPLFVMLAGEYFERSGDLETIRLVWPAVTAAIRWIDDYGDRDRDGFVEYHRESSNGLTNQGWKDSDDAIFHAGGELAKGPIALCEVQGYVFAAKKHAATLAHALGEEAEAARLETAAERLRQAFENRFWLDELSTYALALDGEKRPCRVVASNAGHALFSGIASPERAAQVAGTLMGVACFSGWGIRTLARNAARYNPVSYHNGSVWPHDNALIALGMARYGLKEPVLRIFSGLYDAASYWEPRRLPELFCGFVRRHTSPTTYPIACSPQAWASAAVFALIEASIGLQFNPASSEIRFERPVLPAFLNHLHLRGLRIVEVGIDVLLQRVDGEVAVAVTRREGEARVVASY